MSRAGVVFGVLATGVVAGTTGFLVGRAMAAEKAKPLPPPAPTPASTATSNALLQPITAASQVQPFQMIIAQALAKRPSEMGEWGLTPSDYSVSDVDGDPNNPKWKKLLSTLQKTLNAFLVEEGIPSDAPAGFPPQLRTDGVLDYATSVAIYHL
jgi:hypothetical protein